MPGLGPRARGNGKDGWKDQSRLEPGRGRTGGARPGIQIRAGSATSFGHGAPGRRGSIRSVMVTTSGPARVSGRLGRDIARSPDDLARGARASGWWQAPSVWPPALAMRGGMRQRHRRHRPRESPAPERDGRRNAGLRCRSSSRPRPDHSLQPGATPQSLSRSNEAARQSQEQPPTQQSKPRSRRCVFSLVSYTLLLTFGSDGRLSHGVR